jgi:hypothetical protein
LAFPLFLSLLGVTGTGGESGDTLYVCARSDNAKASTSQHQDSLFRQPIRELKLPPLRPLIYEAVLIPPGAEVLADRFHLFVAALATVKQPHQAPGNRTAVRREPVPRAETVAPRPNTDQLHLLWPLPFTAPLLLMKLPLKSYDGNFHIFYRVALPCITGSIPGTRNGMRFLPDHLSASASTMAGPGFLCHRAVHGVHGRADSSPSCS